MKILISGATGFIGTQLVFTLLKQKHDIYVLVRNPQKAEMLFGNSVQILTYETKSSIEKYDAVIHLAGENVFHLRWSAEKKQKILDSRLETTLHVLNLIQKNPPDVFISASAIGIYPETNDQPSYENTAADHSFLADVVKAWEGPILEATLPRKVILRLPIVLGHQGGAFQKLHQLFLFQCGGILGSGKQWMSWIHIDDLIALFQKCLTDYSGVINAVAGNVTNKEFSQELSKQTSCVLLPKIPKSLLQKICGEASELLLKSHKIQSHILPQSFHFRYPDIQSALQNLCEKARYHYLIQAQIVPHPIEKVFNYFSKASNLEEITPPFLNFKIQEQSTPEIEQGTLIDYELKLHSFPLHWQSKIEGWNPPFSFRDIQIKGPYKTWDHLHTFYDLQGKTLLLDEVRYQLPFHSSLFIHPFVKKELRKIFAYRRQKINELFS